MIHLLCPNPALDRTILVDDFKKNIPIRPSLIRENAGGKSFNVAYALKYFNNLDFCIYTILGLDNGNYIKKLSKSQNLNIKYLESNVNTRICSIYIDKNSNDKYLIYEKGLQTDKSTVNKFIELVEKNINKGDYLVFSGSLMQGMEDDFIFQFMTNHKDLKIVVDTSSNALKKAYLGNPYLIKINDEEFFELFDLDYNKVEKKVICKTIFEILKTKVKTKKMIVTYEKGALAKINDNFYKITGYILSKKELKNPVASGDFFLGVLLNYNLEDEKECFEALKKASAFSSANCLNYFPEVLEEDFKEILNKVKVEKI